MKNKISSFATRRTTNVLLFLKYALLLFACSEQANREQKPEKILENAENKLRIPLDDQTSNTSFGLHYLDGAVPLLFNVVHARNQHQVYDLKAKTLGRTLQFEREGDQGIGGLGSYHVHTTDSIFLFTDQPGKMYLTDIDQSYISVLSYSTPEGYADPEASYLPFSGVPTIRNGKMEMKISFPADYRELTESTLLDKALSATIDLSTSEISLSAHRFPSDYTSGGFRLPRYSMASTPDKTVYSFWADHNLYYASSLDGGLAKVAAKSRFFSETFPTISRDASSSEILAYTLTQHYEGLIYDPCREVFYRFCFPTAETENVEDLRKISNFPDDFSIMILNNELQILGETRFKGYRYMPRNSFVAKEGLYISVSHPDNYDNEEDFFTFVLYRLADGK